MGLIRTAAYKGLAFGQKKAEQLVKAAKEAVKLGIYAPGNATVMTTVLEMLDILGSNVLQLEQELKALIVPEPYIPKNLCLLQTILGIGQHSAIIILTEIGDFTLFQKPKQLAAYFGLDPSERQSGSFVLKTKCQSVAPPMYVQHFIWRLLLPLNFLNIWIQARIYAEPCCFAYFYFINFYSKKLDLA